MRKITHLQHNKKHKNNKEVYTDGSKSIERKYILQQYSQILPRALPEEAPIDTVKMTAIKVALKEMPKRENKTWIIYTGSQSSMLSILNEI